MGKKRPFPKSSVCKPCWELRYCPYGPLVELFPGPSEDVDLGETRKLYAEALDNLSSGKCKTEGEVWNEVYRLFYLSPGVWEQLSKYDPEDVGCRIFGHACPVFFNQSGATETKVPRREGRYISREIMLKVVRRDNHICQECHQYVRDDEVEFDHIIPVGRGGPTSVENVRLLCRACNRKKSDSLKNLLT